MSLSDPISDMIARINNGILRFHKKINVPGSVFKIKILDVLKDEGFINDYSIEENKNNKNNISVNLKYKYGSSVIKQFERVSKPGRRIYSSADSLPKINNGLGITIVSTPKGIMSDIQARKQNIGGEVICKVF
tara:strand:+ start:108 stop:506 length:399 start_codon:yes stop_codon:yes gene_type:complete